jgi:hypothetical protein
MSLQIWNNYIATYNLGCSYVFVLLQYMEGNCFVCSLKMKYRVCIATKFSRCIIFRGYCNAWSHVWAPPAGPFAHPCGITGQHGPTAAVPQVGPTSTGSHVWAPQTHSPTCGAHQRMVPRVGRPALGPTCGPHQRWVPQTQGPTPHLDPTNARSHATYGPTSTWSHKWAPLGPTCEPKFSKNVVE